MTRSESKPCPILSCRPRESGDPVNSERTSTLQRCKERLEYWVPAFAGTTAESRGAAAESRGEDSGESQGAATPSLRPQPELAHHRAPFGLFRVDVGGLLLRRAGEHVAAFLGNARAHVLALERGVELGIEP